MQPLGNVAFVRSELLPDQASIVYKPNALTYGQLRPYMKYCTVLFIKHGSCVYVV